VNDAEIYARTTRNRLAVAELLEGLSPAQWSAATLCEGWTVRHVAAHLLQPMLIGFGRFFLTSLRHRGDTDATVDHLARALARHEADELIALLRQHADVQVDPPRVGPMGPFADTCIHLRDIARPLRLQADAPADDWVALLTYLTSGRAAPGLVAPGRLHGLSLRATDASWHHGNGPEVRGTLEALAMAATGRAAALVDLDGPGVAALASRP
jgi:uncharacterized protein (TIGR03083 family)